MNRNSVRTKVRVAACCLAGAVVISGSSFVSQASMSAGANFANIVAQTNGSGNTTTAGATRNFAQYAQNLAEKTAEKQTTPEETAPEAAPESQEAQPEENQAQEVKSEFADKGVANVEEDSYVNIRSEANTDCEIVGKLYANSAVTVLGTEGEWYKIHSGNCEGYIKQEYIITGNEELAKSISTRVAIVDTDNLNIRDDKTTEGTVLGQVSKSDVLLVVSEEPEWIQVATDEGEGYVSAQYVHCTNFFKVAESKEEEEARLKREAEARAGRESSSSQSSSSKSSSKGEVGKAKSYAPASGGTGADVANYACQFVGNPYVYGGTSLTNGADCSGFIMSVYKAFGVSLPHSSTAMRSVGYAVSASEMRPGDIICYDGHVALCIGSDGSIVHASTPSTGIKYGNAYYKNIITVRRIF